MNNPTEIITSVAVFVFVMFILIIVLDVFRQTKDFEDKE